MIYTHVMVKILSKLPDDPSSDPLHNLYSLELSISSDCVEKCIDYSVDLINLCLEKLRSLFLFNSVRDSLIFGVVVYVVSFIGCLCNLLSLLIMVWVFIFTVPCLARGNIDKTSFDLACLQLQVQFDIVKNKILSLSRASSPLDNLENEVEGEKETLENEVECVSPEKSPEKNESVKED